MFFLYKIIECALHEIAGKLDLGSKVYILNHYTAGVILFGKRNDEEALFVKGNKYIYIFQYKYICILHCVNALLTGQL